jgi:hypothetical protein
MDFASRESIWLAIVKRRIITRFKSDTVNGNEERICQYTHNPHIDFE